MEDLFQRVGNTVNIETPLYLAGRCLVEEGVIVRNYTKSRKFADNDLDMSVPATLLCYAEAALPELKHT